MKSITLGMESHLNGAVTTLCSCWKITRQDGEVLGFTDHDASFVIDGVTYKASSGFYRSAIANSADTGVDNLDVSGFLDDGSLDETELRNGAYDYAEVEVFAANWANLANGIIRLRYGMFGEVTIVSSGFFKVELRGLTQLFSQTIGETYSPECRADLGDERCKVALTPPVRRSAANYGVGARILVPQTPGVSIQLPIGNSGFEEGFAETAWQNPPGAVVSMNEINPLYPWNGQLAYSLVPKVADGYTRFYRSYGQLGDRIPSFTTEVAFDGTGSPEIRMSMKFLDQFGVPSEDPDLIFEGEWLPILPGVHTYDSELIIPELPPYHLDNSGFIWEIEWRGAEPATNLPHYVDPNLRSIRLNPFTMLDGQVIPQARVTPTNVSMATVSAWELSDLNDAKVIGPNVWMSPARGEWMLELAPHTGGVAWARQYVNFGVDMEEYYDAIDTGTMKIEIGAEFGAETAGCANFFSYRFFDENDAAISTDTQAEQQMYARGTWGPYSYAATIPAGTRSVLITVNTKNISDNTLARGVWDNFSGRIYDAAYEQQDNYLAYGKVEFQCNIPGITAQLPPAYDYTIGAVTFDGTAQFTAVVPTHMFTLEITEVISHKQFKVNLNVAKPDGWFDWGVLEVLNGPNIMKRLEVASYDAASKMVTLALPLPYIPVVGDSIRMHTGCAKSRSTCVSKFNNILNYRGEPDLPGTDQYFKVGGANVGGSLG